MEKSTCKMSRFYRDAFAKIYFLEPRRFDKRYRVLFQYMQMMSGPMRLFLKFYLLVASLFTIIFPHKASFAFLAKIPLLKAAHAATVSILLMLYYDEQ